MRLANLKSGQLDFIERMAPSDVPALKSDSRFKISTITEIGYQGITINVGKSDARAEEPARQGSARARGVRAGARPRRHRAGRDGRRGDRRATSGSRRRTRYYAKNMPIPKRDVARAKALLAEAGVPNPSVHADDADHLRRAADRAGRAGDGRRRRAST